MKCPDCGSDVRLSKSLSKGSDNKGRDCPDCGTEVSADRPHMISKGGA